MEQNQERVRFAVAAFNDLNSMSKAETALQQIGRDLLETALLADRASLASKFAASFATKNSSGLLAGKISQKPSASERESLRDELSCDNKVMIETGMSARSRPLVISAGVLSEIFLHAGAGPGVEISPIFETWMPQKQTLFLEEQLAAERLLLWVPIPTTDFEAPICRTLLSHSPYSVHTHDIPATSQMVRPSK